MSNPTSNFGWQMPTPVDLVTDLPADFEVFGQAVDSTLADLKGGTSGQVLSKNSNTDMDFVWTSPNPGDITGVTAGTGISGGGTSGDVTITNSMATAITTNGDLIYGTGSGTFTRRGIGSTGDVLTVTGGVPTWSAPAGGGGMTLLSTTSLSGSSVTISSISGSYTDLRIVMKGAYASGDSDLFVRLNSDTSSNYAHYSLQTADTTASGFYTDSATQVQIGFVTGTNTYQQRTSFVLDLPRYTDTSNCFGIVTLSTYAFSARRQIQNFFKYNNSAAITSFTIYPSSGTFSGGSLYIYGVK
jgi:hypothetical protein